MVTDHGAGSQQLGIFRWLPPLELLLLDARVVAAFFGSAVHAEADRFRTPATTSSDTSEPNPISRWWLRIDAVAVVVVVV